MIEEVAIVKEVHAGDVLVETKVKTTCGQCAVRESCATSTVAKAFSSKSTEFMVHTWEPLVKGDLVKVGIPEKNLVGAAFNIYLLPLFSLFTGVFIISVAFPTLSEWFQLIFGALCAAMTYRWLNNKYNNTNADNQIVPVFIRKINNEKNGSDALHVKQ
ncbi:MAG: SoxR reducing system RseC family protein [Pseudomonadota bacterium]